MLLSKQKLLSLLATYKVKHALVLTNSITKDVNVTTITKNKTMFVLTLSLSDE